MGTNWSGMFGRLFRKSNSEARVAMLGLDNAGKTTILYQLKLERNVQLMPTIGFNVETVRMGKRLFNIWDVSGAQPKTRILWQHYNQNTRAIIFVIDSADHTRLTAAAEQLHWLWYQEELLKAVFLIYANKQDLPDALSAEELVSILRLTQAPHPWAIQECCALNGLGLWDGLEQLEHMMIDVRNKRCSATGSGLRLNRI